jgi:hypothetical protein
MRHLLGFVAVLVGLQLAVSAQATGTPAELADDALARALWRIAVETHTKIGFESVEFVRPWGAWTDTPALPYSSRDEALRATVDADSRYAWRPVGDFVVVRPKNAWNDPANPFNRPIRNLVVENGTSDGVLSGLWDFIYTNKFAVQPGQLRPVSFEVQSGTVVDVLNRLTESADAVWWSASYRPNAQPDQRAPRWNLQMHLRDEKVTVHLMEGNSPTVHK